MRISSLKHGVFWKRLQASFCFKRSNVLMLEIDCMSQDLTMSAVTFTETKTTGADDRQIQNTQYRHNHQPRHGETSQQGEQNPVPQVVDSSTASSAANKAGGPADVAIMIDCGSLCRKHLGVDVPGLGHVWFVHDVCGQVCALITWLLLIYAEFVVMAVVVPQITYPYNIVNAVGYNFFAFLALASHIRATITDPGAVAKGNATGDSIQRLGLKEGEVIYRCPKCVSIKPPRAHHCSICQRCIRKMDHHCPWVNNCIGQNNQKYFVLFTLYICTICIHAFCMGFAHFISCFSAPSVQWVGSWFSPLATVLLLVFLLFESIGFGIFTGSMLYDQMSAIFSDQTYIEQLKKVPARWEKKTRWMSMKSVFSHRFSLLWFSPFATPHGAPCSPHLHTV